MSSLHNYAYAYPVAAPAYQDLSQTALPPPPPQQQQQQPASFPPPPTSSSTQTFATPALFASAGQQHHPHPVQHHHYSHNQSHPAIPSMLAPETPTLPSYNSPSPSPSSAVPSSNGRRTYLHNSYHHQHHPYPSYQYQNFKYQQSSSYQPQYYQDAASGTPAYTTAALPQLQSQIPKSNLQDAYKYDSVAASSSSAPHTLQPAPTQQGQGTAIIVSPVPDSAYSLQYGSFIDPSSQNPTTAPPPPSHPAISQTQWATPSATGLAPPSTSQHAQISTPTSPSFSTAPQFSQQQQQYVPVTPLSATMPLTSGPVSPAPPTLFQHQHQHQQQPQQRSPIPSPQQQHQYIHHPQPRQQQLLPLPPPHPQQQFAPNPNMISIPVSIPTTVTTTNLAAGPLVQHAAAAPPAATTAATTVAAPATAINPTAVPTQHHQLQPPPGTSASLVTQSATTVLGPPPPPLPTSSTTTPAAAAAVAAAAMMLNPYHVGPPDSSASSATSSLSPTNTNSDTLYQMFEATPLDKPHMLYCKKCALFKPAVEFASTTGFFNNNCKHCRNYRRKGEDSKSEAVQELYRISTYDQLRSTLAECLRTRRERGGMATLICIHFYLERSFVANPERAAAILQHQAQAQGIKLEEVDGGPGSSSSLGAPPLALPLPEPGASAYDNNDSIDAPQYLTPEGRSVLANRLVREVRMMDGYSYNHRSTRVFKSGETHKYLCSQSTALPWRQKKKNAAVAAASAAASAAAAAASASNSNSSAGAQQQQQLLGAGFAPQPQFHTHMHTHPLLLEPKGAAAGLPQTDFAKELVMRSMDPEVYNCNGTVLVKFMAPGTPQQRICVSYCHDVSHAPKSQKH